MDLHPLDIAIHIVNIVVLFVLLRAILYKPISNFLQKRTASIEKQLDDAQKIEEQANALKAQYEDKLAHTDEQVKKILDDSTREAGTTASGIVAAAQKRAETLSQEAHEKMQDERRQALTELEQEITGMAVTLAGEILQREVTEEDNRKVIESFFNKVG